jgi:hypothetical protein
MGNTTHCVEGEIAELAGKATAQGQARGAHRAPACTRVGRASHAELERQPLGPCLPGSWSIAISSAGVHSAEQAGERTSIFSGRRTGSMGERKMTRSRTWVASLLAIGFLAAPASAQIPDAPTLLAAGGGEAAPRHPEM